MTSPRRRPNRGRRQIAALAGGLLLAAGLSGCGPDVSTESGPPAAAPRTSGGTGGVNHPAVASRPHVVLISFDGFRPDYLDRFDTPAFDRLAARGLRAAGLISVFPSLTFPGHYSIATGLYPEAHGIVANRFHDPVRNDEFNYRESDDAGDGSWWGGEPIWVTAEKQGMVAAAFFFPGTEADIGGLRPSHWRPYDGSVPNAARVEQVLDWLALSADVRPHLVTLYFSLVDSAGHDLGPDSPDMRRSVEEADRLLGVLTDGVAALPHAGRVALVVVSDHGMAAPDPDRLTVLPELADLSGIRTVPAGAALSLHVGDPERSGALRDELNARLTHARAYLREEIPAHLHARDNPRIGDILVIPDGLGLVGFRRTVERVRLLLRPGMHGWDPRLPEMHGILLAAGPGIAAGVGLPAIRAVDVYPLIAHLLDLTPHPGVAGDLSALAPALTE
ncbi:MAG: alkaline phosphatase family protein [Acidobacteria bacterium]|nr:alkaline phosphatase family protein [Acidobacteriota bacterium]